jgi:hypothetical protein
VAVPNLSHSVISSVLHQPVVAGKDGDNTSMDAQLANTGVTWEAVMAAAGFQPAPETMQRAQHSAHVRALMAQYEADSRRMHARHTGQGLRRRDPLSNDLPRSFRSPVQNELATHGLACSHGPIDWR